MLAAAARSAGVTTAITYELRVGTSICERALRASSNAMTQPRLEANGTIRRSTLEGKCVNTIVLTRPMRRAIRAAIRYENAESTPVQKKIVAATATESSNRSKSHSASNDCTTKPPPKASRLKSDASR